MRWIQSSASAVEEKSQLIIFCSDVQDGEVLEGKFAAEQGVGGEIRRTY